MKTKLFFSIFLITFLAAFAVSANAGSMNGVAGVMPAYYDGTVFNINFKELPAGGEKEPPK